MALTDVLVRQAKPKDKSYKLVDGRGLFLLIMPTGAKYWRMRYSWKGKENTLAFGVYPDISLRDARLKRDEARLALAQGVNPKVEKALVELTFEVVAREWYEKHMLPTKAPTHTAMIISQLERLIFPHIGILPVNEVKPKDLISMLKPLEARGVIETAHRVLQICGQVLRYAVARGHAEHDSSAALRGALPPRLHKHHASITEPRKIAGLIRAIDSFPDSATVQCALRFSMLTFQRPGEIRHAEWAEINLSTAEWRISAEKMKKTKEKKKNDPPHIVPLSRQALEVLQRIREFTGHGRYVFPSIRAIVHGNMPMSEATIVVALRRMGYGKEEMCAHGFRTMASTNLNEARKTDGSRMWSEDAIERQLAHVEHNKVRSAYNQAENLPERREMMQWYADWLDSLRE